MIKGLRRKFILFAMSAVTILLAVLVGALNGLNWIILDGQSGAILHTLTSANGMFKQMSFQERPLLPPLNMDMMHSTRFFTVRTDEEGTVLDVNLDQISSVDAETAKSYAGQINRTTGKIDEYKYEVKQLGSERLIVFMDTSGQQRSFLMVLMVSSAIAFALWIAVLLFVILLSGKVVRPIAAGMEKQKQFITNAGHELKTPLAIIQSNNDAMTLIYGENKYNTNIRLQTRRLNTLMSNLLTLAKLDEEVKLPTEPENISGLICEVLAAYEDAAKARQISLSAQIMPDIQMRVHRDTFLQLIAVLLDNAVKYTPDGGAIRISLRQEEHHVIIIEENTCEALHDGDAERLFERFYRGDNARTQNGNSSGYGIGLSAARAIMETFGGKLTAEYPCADQIRFTARF